MSPTAAEVLNISAHGIWILVRGREYFLDYEMYPWFREAKVADILDVELLHDNDLHWPNLDIDLELECLDNPHKYPLVYR
jgi:hypothetical protein